MRLKGPIGIAACLTMSLHAGVAARAEAEARGHSPTQAAFPPVVDTTEWFRLSFEPVRKMEAAPLQSGVEPSLAEPERAPPTQQEIQVPAAVQNLRRADL